MEMASEKPSVKITVIPFDSEEQIDNPHSDSELSNKSEPLLPTRNNRISLYGSQIISNPVIVDRRKISKTDADSESKGVSRNRGTLSRPVSVVDISYNNGIVVNNKFHAYKGAVLTILASLILSASSIIVKSLSDKYHPFTLSLWTFQGIFIPSLIAILLEKLLWKKNKSNSKLTFWKGFLVLARALLGCGGTVLKVYSLQYITAADSSIITFISPPFIGILAWIFLREKCGIIPTISMLIVLVGGGIIIRPPMITHGVDHFDQDLLVGASMAFGCMICGSFAVIVLRLIREVNYALVTFIYGLIGTITAVGLCYLPSSNGIELPQNTTHWIFAVTIAGLTFLGQALLTIALKFEMATLVAVLRPSEIIFAFALEWLWLGTSPQLISCIGALTVIFGLALTSARKWVSSLRPRDQERWWCKWLLW